MTRDELEARFAGRALPHGGGLLLLRPDDAKALVREAAAARIAILGVDGIFVSTTKTVSPLEHVADFSTPHRREDGFCTRLSGLSTSGAILVSFSKLPWANIS